MADGTPLARVRHAYEQLLAGTALPDGVVRAVVRESWQRSLGRGISPEQVSADTGRPMSDDDLAAYRAAHPLSPVLPLVRSLIVDDIADAGVVVTVADEHGRLLWIDGDSQARDKAAGINFVEGSVWSEDTVGTNAPGLALAVDQSVQIRGPEHFSGPVQHWNCAAAPVHDPATGRLLGVIDVTGGKAAAAPFALAAVRSVVAAVERELQSRAVDLADPEAFDRPEPAIILNLLDGAGPNWCAPGGSRRPLSRRHGEILLLLHSYPEGRSTEELAMALSEDDLDAVTVRAEISRLRRDLGDVIAARPYRLTVPVDCDVTRVAAMIADGDTAGAITALGRGGLLAESLAPGVVELFEELREDLRSQLLAAGDPSGLTAWTSSPLGRDDGQAWRRLVDRLPEGDPQRAVAAGRARLLDRRFGLG